MIWNGTSITNFEGGTVTGVETVNANLGGGTDTLNFAGSTSGVTVNLATPSASGFASIVSIENVTGGSGVDNLTGGTGTNILTGGGGADNINMAAVAAEVVDIVRFSDTIDFGDSVTNFDANGTVDRVEFTGALNTAYDDGNNNDTFLFATGNGGAGSVNVTVGQGNGDAEAVLLLGAGGEGVTTANLGNAGLVATAFNAEFGITAANGEDALLVINDTDGNSASMWHWVQAGGGEISAAEITLIGIITANATITAASFDIV